MMKSLRILFALTLSVLFGLTSCEETTDAGEFDNWQSRNTQFIDSIADVARENAYGDWKVFLAEGLDATKVWGDEYYVYCQVLEAGTGSGHPLFTDSVVVNYSGRLMPSDTYPDGYQFDSSYSGEFNPSFNVPVGMKLSATVPGFYTAVQQMVDGDRWMVYIPYQLGYGAKSVTGVPAYSSLVFDINLVSFHR